MNHQGLIAHNSQDLLRQNLYNAHSLDDDHFAHLNHIDALVVVNGYCLDAPCRIPAGSVETSRGWGRGLQPIPTELDRDLTPAEIAALERELDLLLFI
jgi:hypothetical protein